MNGIDDVAAFVVGLRQDEIPAGVMEKLRLHGVDTLAAWVAATRTAEGKALIAFRREASALDDATVDAGNASDEITVHCALARLSEIDDIHLASMTTPGSIVIPTALSISTRLADPNADVAAAVLGGYEAMIRLGLAIDGPSLLNRGIWPSYFTAPFACAAVAARLLRLNETQTSHALALALTMAAPSVGQHRAETAARWLSVGNAARNGLTAALAARSGFTSDVDILKSRFLPDIYGIAPDPAAMTTAGDGGFCFRHVAFNPWWAARQTMAAAQALRELIDGGLSVGDATKIDVSVLPPHLKMIDHGVIAGDRTSYLTSLPYQMAVAALQPDAALNIGPAAKPPSPAVQALMARITVSADEALLAAYPQAWPARVVVTTASGKTERLVQYVPGDPARPFAERDVKRKFYALVAPVMDQASAQEAWQEGLAMLRAAEASAAVMRRLNRLVAWRMIHRA